VSDSEAQLLAGYRRVQGIETTLNTQINMSTSEGEPSRYWENSGKSDLEKEACVIDQRGYPGGISTGAEVRSGQDFRWRVEMCWHSTAAAIKHQKITC
jgi:hypothetical protein